MNEHLYKGNVQGAYIKGYEAAKALESINDNPYDYAHRVNGRSTILCALHNAWCDGWNDFVHDQMTKDRNEEH
jgi:hypothetical protein